MKKVLRVFFGLCAVWVIMLIVFGLARTAVFAEELDDGTSFDYTIDFSNKNVIASSITLPADGEVIIRVSNADNYTVRVVSNIKDLDGTTIVNMYYIDGKSFMFLADDYTAEFIPEENLYEDYFIIDCSSGSYELEALLKRKWNANEVSFKESVVDEYPYRLEVVTADDLFCVYLKQGEELAIKEEISELAVPPETPEEEAPPAVDNGSVEQTPSSDDTAEPSLSEEDEGNALVDAFIQELKNQYGDDYQKYYDAIIEQWGSIKAYIYAKIDDGTLSESSDSWATLIKWLDEYSVVWAPILAVIIIIILFVVGRKVYQVIKLLFTKLFKGSNQTASAQIAIIDALETMLGNSEKTKEQREKLENAKEELLKNE